MTLIVKVGRRLPKTWFRRGVQKISRILNFQDHIWMIIKNSFKQAQKKCKKAKPHMVFEIIKDKENESINYTLEWVTVVIQGTEAEEEDEYNDMLSFYKPLGKLFDKEKLFKKDKTLMSQFKSKIVNTETIERMYKQGYDSTSENSIQNKLLELGILCDLVWHRDWEDRIQDF